MNKLGKEFIESKNQENWLELNIETGTVLGQFHETKTLKVKKESLRDAHLHLKFPKLLCHLQF